jgi:hypothetical protein
MVVSKQTIPTYIGAALPELVADILAYLELEESDEFTADDLTLAGYYSAGPSVAFLVYEYKSDDEPGIAAIRLNQKSRLFQDACVFSWGREEGQSIEEALVDFLEMNPPA